MLQEKNVRQFSAPFKLLTIFDDGAVTLSAAGSPRLCLQAPTTHQQRGDSE